MPVSAFDLFKIGIGPSSSHTVGPMRIALEFVRQLERERTMMATAAVEVHLYGSLALTGRGHATDRAVMLGLMGHEPERVNIELIDTWLQAAGMVGCLTLMGHHSVAFNACQHIHFHKDRTLPAHPNGMRLVALDAAGAVLADETRFSIGGGFTVTEETLRAGQSATGTAWPHPYRSAAELLAMCHEHSYTIAQLAMGNELALREKSEVFAQLDRIRDAMVACMDRGLTAQGVLPGGLGVRRRAKGMHETLMQRAGVASPLRELDWVNAFAVAVNEENAAGARVVTAPTNGAAGIVPAVLRYFERFCDGALPHHIRDFLLTAAAIGSLYKENASISGAEVGCQGEVGVASSMAAAGLAAVLGGSNEQIENAAEIAMEHNLGLTCDPVGGLVQVPCIERNAMGAVKAINAAHQALAGDGQHLVSLDKVIQTMKQTGADMHAKYKETSLGGLAVNVVAC